MKILITGGCGFIGSALVRRVISTTEWSVVNIDALTYAAQPSNVGAAESDPRYKLVQANICDAAALDAIFTTEQPDGLIHLAAESHVDRSIDTPDVFLQTNVVGTFELLQATRRYLGTLPTAKRNAFRFHHVSTDEVYGTLSEGDAPSTETSPYNPRSPYSATKAASDHLVNAWHHTYGVPTLASHGTNTYGPYQYPEKLIPLTITRALSGQSVNVAGRGDAVRDWIHTDDHADAILTIFQQGIPGSSYNLGAHNPLPNLTIIHAVLSLLDELEPRADGLSYTTQLTHVPERAGHDTRYSLNAEKLATELNWQPQIPLTDGLRQTVLWYLKNRTWWQNA